MREGKQVADWILILYRWLIGLPGSAAQILEGIRIARVDGVWADYAASQPLFRSIRWMTFCLGQGWSIAPRGLMPALVSRSGGRAVSRYVSSGYVSGGAAAFIRGDHILSCSERVPGGEGPALGACGHLTDFSRLADAADL
jgi:hypothetical protein